MILDCRLTFPDPRQALQLGRLNGLVALGGDLSVARLLLAYRSGIFPWSVNPITWWSPDPRGIFELEGFRVSRSLARTLKRVPFQITFNRAFSSIMLGCAEAAPDRPSSWITSQFIDAYTQLHSAGHAHSIECWLEDRLVGGVYGVQVGGLFAGESMFHRVTDASKVALYYLVLHLQEARFQLFDIQMISPHTQRLGAVNISRDEYLARLERAVEAPCRF